MSVAIRLSLLSLALFAAACTNSYDTKTPAFYDNLAVDGVTVNGEEQLTIAGDDFFRAMLRIWLGNKPVDVEFAGGLGRWLDGRWWFMDLTVQAYKANGDLDGAPEIILQKEMRDLRETPQTFMAEIKDPQYLSASEMRHYLRAKKDISGNTRARLMVDMHSRLATPFACLVVTLIGVPIGAHTGRRGAFAGIMTAMSLFFGFYILQLTGQALGKQEIIPAILGGWLPVIVFGAASPLFIHRMR